MKIVSYIEQLVNTAKTSGVQIGNTLEIHNVHHLTWDFSDTNFDLEYNSVDKFYSECGLSLAEKYKEEEYHYNFLKYGLLQKIRAVKYFHNQGLDSRKLVLFSEDCISLLQWRTIPGLNLLNVYIRSSDALGLLGSDLLYLYDTALAVEREFPEISTNKLLLDVTIGSCHIYFKEDEAGNRSPMTRDGYPVNMRV